MAKPKRNETKREEENEKYTEEELLNATTIAANSEKLDSIPDTSNGKVNLRDYDIEVIENNIPQEELERTNFAFNADILIPRENQYMYYKYGDEEVFIRRNDIKCAILQKKDNEYVSNIILEDSGLIVSLKGRVHFDLIRFLFTGVNIQKAINYLEKEKELHSK